MTKEKRCLVYSAAHNAKMSAHAVKAAAKLEIGSNVQWRLTQAGCGLGISIGSADWHVVWQANLQAGGRSLLRIGGPVSLGSTLSISGQFGVTWPRSAIPKCLKVPRASCSWRMSVFPLWWSTWVVATCICVMWTLTRLGRGHRCIDHRCPARGRKLGQCRFTLADTSLYMHAGDNMPGFDLTVRLVKTSLALLDAIF